METGPGAGLGASAGASLGVTAGGAAVVAGGTVAGALLGHAIEDGKLSKLRLDAMNITLAMAEHTKNARPSTLEDHKSGKARKKRDRGGEEGDRRRGPNRKRPGNWKGPWPPNASFLAPEDDSDDENTCE